MSTYGDDTYGDDTYGNEIEEQSMATMCLPKGCIFLTRFFAVDQCGFTIIAGAGNGYATEGLRNFEITTNNEESTTVKIKNDCGKNVVTLPVCGGVENYTFAFETTNTEYELYGLLTDNGLIVDDPGSGTQTVGRKVTEDSACRPYLGVETFSKVSQGSCDNTDTIEVVRNVYVVRFDEPTETRQSENDQTVLTSLQWSGTSIPFAPDSYGDGPFNDSYVDFTGDVDNVHMLEFYDNIDPDTLSGTCGTLTVPAQA